jgi:5-formyltetrahydrofolate cyclo-ligase
MAGAFDQKAASDSRRFDPHIHSSDKKSLRKEIINRRDSIAPDSRKSKDAEIVKRLTDMRAYGTAGTILLYAAFRSEVSTEKLIRQTLSDGRKVVLPRVESSSGTLKLFAIGDWSDLVPGCWGIPEPVEAVERSVNITEVDIVIAPGVAFDVNCNRLGYGKGFYDKLLFNRRTAADGSLHPIVAGLAYEEQIVSYIPCSPHDMKMDFIITDKRIIDCHGLQKD